MNRTTFYKFPKTVGFRGTKKILIEKHGANFLQVIDALVEYPVWYQLDFENKEKPFTKLFYGNLSRDTGLSIDTLKHEIKYLESLDFITVKNNAERNSMLYVFHFNHLFNYIRNVEFEMEDEFEKWISMYKVRDYYTDLFYDCRGNLIHLTEDTILNRVFDSIDHVDNFIYLVDYGVKMYKKDYFKIIENYSPTVMNLINDHVYDDFERRNLTYPYYNTMQLTYAIEKEKLDKKDSIFDAPLFDISKDELIICIHNKIVTAIKHIKYDNINNEID